MLYSLSQQFSFYSFINHHLSILLAQQQKEATACTPQCGNMLPTDATPQAYAGGPELGRPTPGGHPQSLQMTTCMQGYN